MGSSDFRCSQVNFPTFFFSPPPPPRSLFLGPPLDFHRFQTIIIIIIIIIAVVHR